MEKINTKYGTFTSTIDGKKTAKEVYEEWLKNKDKETVTQPTQQEKLNAQLLMENAEIKKQLNEQQKINANMLVQIAKLGGTQ